MTTTTDYLVRPVEPADEPEVRRLVGTALAGGPTGERTAEFYRWKHRENPFGASPGLVAVEGERIVGLRLFMRWEFRSGGRRIRAVRPVDTATHPDHRGRGIFRRLTTQLVEEVTGDAELVFNTPNTNSLPGYLRMGWHSVGIAPVLVRPVEWVAFARGFRSAGEGGQGAGRRGVAAELRERCPLPEAATVVEDPRLPGLLTVAAPPPDQVRLHTPRTVEFLRWRYAQAPGLDYRAIRIEDGGELVGVGFGRLRPRGDLREFTLADVICARGDRRAARAVLRAACGAGGDHVATHVAAHTTARAVSHSAGYLGVRGTGIQLVARPLAEIRPTPLSLDSWQLSLGDLEVF